MIWPLLQHRVTCSRFHGFHLKHPNEFSHGRFQKLSKTFQSLKFRSKLFVFKTSFLNIFLQTKASKNCRHRETIEPSSHRGLGRRRERARNRLGRWSGSGTWTRRPRFVSGPLSDRRWRWLPVPDRTWISRRRPGSGWSKAGSCSSQTLPRSPENTNEIFTSLK